MKVNLICAYCGKEIEKELSEYNRQIKNGRDPNMFFCNNNCSSKYFNNFKKSKIIKKICPVCGKSFKTKQGSKETTFCSRECASKGSVTDKRREAAIKSSKENFIPGNAYTIQNILKSREEWKYKEIRNFLSTIDCKYEFEYIIENYIYDLVIFDNRMVIEFDGPDHKNDYQIEIDKNKEIVARKHGFSFKRQIVEPNSIIDPTFLRENLWW